MYLMLGIATLVIKSPGVPEAVKTGYRQLGVVMVNTCKYSLHV